MKNIYITSILLFLSTLAHAQTWQQLDSLGQALTREQKYKAADSILQIALKKVKTLHGKDTSYAFVLQNLGLNHYYQGNQTLAKPEWSESRAIIGDVLGKKSNRYTDLSDNLGYCCLEQGEYEDSEQYFLEVLAIREETFGNRSKKYARSCTNLGMLYDAKGDYAKSEQHYLKALDIIKEVLGEKNISYIDNSGKIALLYYNYGYFEKSKTILKEIINIAKEVLGKENASYFFLCNLLAINYSSTGDFSAAEPLYIETKAIAERVNGKQHSSYANLCYNMANFYREQGLYSHALPLSLEVKEINESLYGKSHGSYAQSCNVTAIIYKAQGLYEKAEALLLESMTILEGLLGKNSLDYQFPAQTLANLYKTLGQYDKALPLLMESKRVKKEILGDKHPEYATACFNLGNLYLEKKEYVQAEALYQEALDICTTTLGEKHPDYAQYSHALGVVYHSTQNLEKANSYYSETIKNKQEMINTLFPIYSEQDKYAAWQEVSYYSTDYYSLACSYSALNPKMTAPLYNYILFTKGIIFSSTQKMKNAILNSRDTALTQQFNNWKEQRKIYTRLYQTSLEEQKKQNLNLDSIKSQIDILEKDLSKKSNLFGQNVQTKSYEWQEVKAKLAKNEAVIEIVKTDSAYIALFLTAQTASYPAFYVFPNAKNLETNYLSFYKNCIEFKIEDTISYNIFWKPIADKLVSLNKKGFKKIYFSPDGVFHQLSLNALKNPKTKKFLLEDVNIQLIGSSRDLIELNKKKSDLSQSYNNYQACLLGYPIYGTADGESIKNRDRTIGFSSVQSAVGVAGSVSLLPGTKKEVENLFALFNQKKLKVNLLLAESATEDAVKNLKSPTILHVATHGFFIPEIKDSEVQDMQTAMNRNLLKNPFMRSGLLLAGCQKPNPEGEDGILTAEEVMNLTLDNTELVVMSACETGLGDIQAGEGVFGLQRAFQQAGAKSVLMSLWKVDDDATQTLMTEFYTALLKGQSKRQAFKTAQMNLKKRFPEPYYWGAFVMVGE